MGLIGSMLSDLIKAIPPVLVGYGSLFLFIAVLDVGLWLGFTGAFFETALVAFIMRDAFDG